MNSSPPHVGTREREYFQDMVTWYCKDCRTVLEAEEVEDHKRSGHEVVSYE